MTAPLLSPPPEQPTDKPAPRPAAPSAGLAVPDPLGPEPSPGRGGVAYLLDAVRLRPLGRRALSALSVLLFAVGAVMFAYPFFTDMYTATLQQRLETRFEDEGFTQQLAAEYGQAPGEPGFDEHVVESVRMVETLQPGDPLTRIVVPALKLDAIVVEGTSPVALRAGAGHYPTTPLPGQPGNVAIAGHRTTYGKPFNRLDQLRVGDEVVLETPLARHTYRVVPAPADAATPCPSKACWITTPTDWGVISPTAAPMLTLTTCHPKGSARQRLIVRAELVGSTPRSDQQPAG